MIPHFSLKAQLPQQLRNSSTATSSNVLLSYLLKQFTILPSDLPSFSASSHNYTMAPIKVGLMGYGGSTKIFHLPYILPNPDLDVVAFLQRAEAPQDKTGVEAGKHCTIDFPKAKHYRTAKDFLADDDIELVSVCTSSATHFELGVS